LLKETYKATSGVSPALYCRRQPQITSLYAYVIKTVTLRDALLLEMCGGQANFNLQSGIAGVTNGDAGVDGGDGGNIGIKDPLFNKWGCLPNICGNACEHMGLCLCVVQHL